MIEKLNSELNELKSERQTISTGLYRSKLHKHRDVLVREQKQRLVDAIARNVDKRGIATLEADFIRELQDYDRDEAQGQANIHNLDSKIGNLETKIADYKLEAVLKTDPKTLADFKGAQVRLTDLQKQIDAKKVERNKLDEAHNEIRIRGGQFYGSTAGYDAALTAAYEPIRKVQIEIDQLNRELNAQKQEVEKIRVNVDRKLAAVR